MEIFWKLLFFFYLKNQFSNFINCSLYHKCLSDEKFQEISNSFVFSVWDERSPDMMKNEKNRNFLNFGSLWYFKINLINLWVTNCNSFSTFSSNCHSGHQLYPAFRILFFFFFFIILSHCLHWKKVLSTIQRFDRMQISCVWL